MKPQLYTNEVLSCISMRFPLGINDTLIRHQSHSH